MRPLAELRAGCRPWVVAHRGFSARYPENTLVAFAAAADAGADMIELDVTLSADRVPVVIHDETLDRTTDGSGPVASRPLADLARLDAGAWFAPEFAGERIPTLDTVLARFGGRITLNLELKHEAFAPDGPPDALEAQVAALVDDFGVRDSVLVSSFDPRFLPRMPGFARAALFEGPACEVADADIVALHPEATRLRETDVRGSTLPVVPWTVNDESAMRRLLAWGVAGMFTDDPELLRRIVDE
jgi:glycerophosphoryl diester phosphodiesterase